MVGLLLSTGLAAVPGQSTTDMPAVPEIVRPGELCLAPDPASIADCPAWADRHPDEVGADHEGVALGTSGDGEVLHAVSYQPTGPDADRWHVVRYDAATGDADSPVRLAEPPAGYEAVDAEIDPDRGLVVTTMKAGGFDPPEHGWVIAGYDTKTSTMVWENIRYHPAQLNGASPQGSMLARDGSMVIVAGSGAVEGFGFRQGVIEAYDTVTGEVLWNETVAKAGTTIQLTGLAATGDGLLIASVWDEDAPDGSLAVGIDIETGETVWQTASPFEEPARGLAVTTNSRAGVVVAGERDVDAEQDAFIASLDPADGEVSWTARYPGTAERVGFTDVEVAPGGSTVLALGAERRPQGDGVIVAAGLDASSGDWIWVSHLSGPAEDKPDRPIGLQVAPSGECVYVAATTYGSLGAARMTVAAFDVSTGHRVWETAFPGYTVRYERTTANAMTLNPTGSAIHLVGTSGRSPPTGNTPIFWTVDQADERSMLTATYEAPC